MGAHAVVVKVLYPVQCAHVPAAASSHPHLCTSPPAVETLAQVVNSSNSVSMQTEYREQVI